MGSITIRQFDCKIINSIALNSLTKHADERLARELQTFTARGPKTQASIPNYK